MSREYSFFSTGSLAAKTLLYSAVVIVFLIIFIPSTVSGIDAKPVGCSAPGGTTTRTSPFSATSSECLGQTDTGKVAFQFSVTFNVANANANVTAKSDSGTTINFVKQSDTLYVSQAGSNGLGYVGAVPSNTALACNPNDPANVISITVQASGQSQSFTEKLCDYATSKGYIIEETANTITNGDNGATAPKPTTGCIQQTLIMVRDNPTPNWTTQQRNANFQQDAVTYIEVVNTVTKNTVYKASSPDTNSTATQKWFTLKDGLLTISGLQVGNYTITLKYNDKIQVIKDIGQGADIWTSGETTFTLKPTDVTIKKDGTCTQIQADSMYFSSTTGQLTAAYADPGVKQQKSTCAITGIGWILCPMLTFLGSVSDSAYNYLANSFLKVDTQTVTLSQDAWSKMRDVADIAFVIVFLFIIFSQLTGQGVTNYGVKKMLPRLVVAAILVNVSFLICQIAVDLSNILGFSLSSALGAFDPVKQASKDSGTNWVGLVETVIAGVAVGWALGVSVLLPFLLGAVVAVIMTFLILVLRQMLIILLVVVSPVAFVAYLLPNTEQWFTKWRKMFAGLLLVFPLIGLLFGASTLASHILQTVYTANPSDPNSQNNTVGQIVAQAVLVLPLFLLPSLLKSSINAAGNIGAKINSIGGRLSKGTQTKVAGSGVMRSMANQRQRTRAQIGAGIYSGRNPLSRLRSSINGGLNKSEKYNALTGDYGTIRGANINKLEDEETKLAEAAIQLQARGDKGTAIEVQFAEAIKRGDIVKAKAAQNILMQKGGPGVDSVRDVLSKSSMSAGMSRSLADNILEKHAQAAKQKGADVLRWAADGGGQSIDSVASTGATWANLSAQDLVGQSDKAFASAVASNGITKTTIEAFKSSQMREALTEKKRAALYAYTNDVAFAPGTGTAPSTPQNTPVNPDSTLEVDHSSHNTPPQDLNQNGQAPRTPNSDAGD